MGTCFCCTFRTVTLWRHSTKYGRPMLPSRVCHRIPPSCVMSTGRVTSAWQGGRWRGELTPSCCRGLDYSVIVDRLTTSPLQVGAFSCLDPVHLTTSVIMLSVPIVVVHFLSIQSIVFTAQQHHHLWRRCRTWNSHEVFRDDWLQSWYRPVVRRRRWFNAINHLGRRNWCCLVVLRRYWRRTNRKVAIRFLGADDQLVLETGGGGGGGDFNSCDWWADRRGCCFVDNSHRFIVDRRAASAELTNDVASRGDVSSSDERRCVSSLLLQLLLASSTVSFSSKQGPSSRRPLCGSLPQYPYPSQKLYRMNSY